MDSLSLKILKPQPLRAEKPSVAGPAGSRRLDKTTSRGHSQPKPPEAGSGLCLSQERLLKNCCPRQGLLATAKETGEQVHAGVWGHKGVSVVPDWKKRRCEEV